MRFVSMVVSTALVLVLAAAVSAEVETTPFEARPDDPRFLLGSYTFPDPGARTLNLTVGVGSGAFRGPLDILGTFWSVGDRGPNIACDEAPAVLNVPQNTACPADGAHPAGEGRLYPLPGFSPSIYQLRLALDGSLRMVRAIPLKTRGGTPITGLPNPLTTATTEVPRNGAGQVIVHDASAVDAEAIVHVPLIFGGRFFVGEENGPSLLEVAADGRILKRFVPAGTEGEFTNPPAGIAPAGYDIDGSLPGILARRRLNRGIESLAISPDYRHLYVLLQSPLENPPSPSAIRDSFNLRLLKLRIHWKPGGSDLVPVGEWIYRLERVAVFQALGATDAGRQRDLRLSEMLALGVDRFLVIERTDQVTLLFEIDLAGATDILGTPWDDVATTPTLEQLDPPASPNNPGAEDELLAAGIQPVTKTLRLVASSLDGAEPRYPPKLEALACGRDGRLIVVNDDDFGITGQRTEVNLVSGTGICGGDAGAADGD